MKYELVAEIEAQFGASKLSEFGAAAVVADKLNNLGAKHMATMATICWGLSELSFQASKDDHYPHWMQRSFGLWGSYWFLTAVAWQGDAMRFWLEVCKESLKDKRPPPDLRAGARTERGGASERSVH